MIWADEVKLRVEALHMPIPKAAVCSHFGVHFIQGGREISIADHHGCLRVVVQAVERRGFTGRTFRAWRDAIRVVAPVLQYWNGEQGNNSMSMVLAMPTPPPFLRALERYRTHATREGFRRFCVAYGENLAKVRAQLKATCGVVGTRNAKLDQNRVTTPGV